MANGVQNVISNLSVDVAEHSNAADRLTTVLAASIDGPGQQLHSLRKNGKGWHPPKQPFRPTAGLTSYAKRKQLDAARQETRAREQDMKEEKAAERDRRIQTIKNRRKAKEEKERYEKMAEKMHRKLVERRKRREKRNKLLHSGK